MSESCAATNPMVQGDHQWNHHGPCRVAAVDQTLSNNFGGEFQEPRMNMSSNFLHVSPGLNLEAACHSPPWNWNQWNHLVRDFRNAVIPLCCLAWMSRNNGKAIPMIDVDRKSPCDSNELCSLLTTFCHLLGHMEGRVLGISVKHVWRTV